MSDENSKKAPETRALTITLSARVTREQADKIVAMTEALCEAVTDCIKVPIAMVPSAPPDTSDGGVPSAPCDCFACQIKRALGIDTAAQRAAEAPASGPQINTPPPSRGPWGAS